MENASSGASLALLQELLAASETAYELAESHLSWVALTDRFAYKLRKPVKFRFLEMRRAEQRQRVSLEELQCLRQFAAVTQPEVLSLARSRWGEVRLGGATQPVDWVLRMRRLRPGASLREKWHHGLALADQNRLECLLDRVLNSALPVCITPEDFTQRLERRIQENEEDLSTVLPPALQGVSHALHAGLRAFCRRQAEIWQQRVCDGRIVQGHGNLRPEHIFLVDPPVAIDGMECGAEPRVVDTCEEVSALLVECDLAGQTPLAQHILEGYAATVAESPDAPLWSFYKCWRALWRAKSQALASRVATRRLASRCTDYLTLAEGYVRQLHRIGATGRAALPAAPSRLNAGSANAPWRAPAVATLWRH